MDKLISLFTNQWLRKLIALLAAIFVWLFVDQSITDTITIPNVPIRIINLPDDMTISGIQPNGILNKRINLTLSGTKNVIQSLGPGDLQILVDAANINQEEWILHINRNNLVSLNPSINLRNSVNHVRNPDYIIKLSKLTKASIPIKIYTKGSPPSGYELLDVWPRQLQFAYVGSEEEVRQLSQEGLSLEIDLGVITKGDLDKLSSSKEHVHDAEINYQVPANLKKISHWLLGNLPVEINDPEARHLHIDFLRQKSLSIGQDIAIRVFYPLSSIEVINPSTYPLLENKSIKKLQDLFFISAPFYVQNVSSLFLDVVRDNLEIVIMAQAGEDIEHLAWSLSVVDSQVLENRYVSYLFPSGKKDEQFSKSRENHIRNRFRKYLRKLALFTAADEPFQLDAALVKDGIMATPIDVK
ncbi:MAG: CdaR family protein [Parachlamydiaceae bacterium]